LTLYSVVAAIIVRIVWLPTPDQLHDDATASLPKYVLATQITLTFAVITSSVPVLSRFLDVFESGMLRIKEGKTFQIDGQKSYSGVFSSTTANHCDLQLEDKSNSRGLEVSDTTTILKSVSWQTEYEEREDMKLQPDQGHCKVPLEI